MMEDYAQDNHTTEIDSEGHHASFKSENLSLSLTITVNDGDSSGGLEQPTVALQKALSSNHLGDGVKAQFRLLEGQSVTFILHDSQDIQPSTITTAMVDEVQETTHRFWSRWISQSKYHGRWESVVTRSLLILKLLTYEPTGAIVAAPTFSLPEDFGGKNPVLLCFFRSLSALYFLRRNNTVLKLRPCTTIASSR
jgi:hypothetical protein